MSWIPVGTCGTVLAVGGILVSMVQCRGYRRWMFAAAFSLLGLSECMSISNAKTAHEEEIWKQARALESLQANMQANEIKNAGDLAYLRAKLEDEQKVNGEYAPAIKRLAETGADYMRKQYEMRVETDAELFAFTNQTVEKIRAFSRRCRDADANISNQQLTKRLPLTESERQTEWQQELEQSSEKSNERYSEFRSSILPEAIYARSELLRRKVAEPITTPLQQFRLRSVLAGSLAGVYPELELADYLELMARPLSRR